MQKHLVLVPQIMDCYSRRPVDVLKYSGWGRLWTRKFCMRGRKSAVVVELSVEQRNELKKLTRSRTVKAGLQKRARAVLGIADGLTFRETMKRVGMTDKHIRNWCRRYLKTGIEGLNDLPGRGRKPSFSPRSGDPHREACL